MGIREYRRSGQRRRRSLGMMEGGPDANDLDLVLIPFLTRSGHLEETDL